MIRREPPSRRRIGFTLIELMVVIVIIGILIALLLPAIIGAVRKTYEAKVSGDIQTIALGLSQFKNTYGEFPPSRVILSENGVYTASGAAPSTNGSSVGPFASDNTVALSSVTYRGNLQPFVGNPDISFGELANRSLRILRKMYPRAALGPETSSGYWPDFNGNNTLDAGAIYLEGDECLVFFLGGIPNPTANVSGTISYGMSGFGKSPRYPFTNATTTPNRAPVSYEFKAERLLDDDQDGVPGYLDANATNGNGSFYAYFVSYGAAGYDPNDVNTTETDDLGATAGTTFRVGTPVITSSGPSNTVFSASPNPYTASLPTPINAGGFSPNQSASYVNPVSYQIISSGGDGLFGAGGQWSSSGDPMPAPPVPPYQDQTSLRKREDDNITNFAARRLN